MKAMLRCRREECRRTLPPLAIRDKDPFCSTDCCRKVHNCYVPAGRERSKDLSLKFLRTRPVSSTAKAM